MPLQRVIHLQNYTGCKMFVLVRPSARDPTMPLQRVLHLQNYTGCLSSWGSSARDPTMPFLFSWRLLQETSRCLCSVLFTCKTIPDARCWGRTSLQSNINIISGLKPRGFVVSTDLNSLVAETATHVSACLRCA